MIKKDEGISKKEIIRNYLQGFILASLTTSGIIIVFSTKIHWGWIIIGAGYWALFCGVLGIATYYYHKSHPELSKKMNCPEIKRGFSQANIYLGMLFILIGIYEFLSAEILSGRKFSLIIIGFGILTILWGYLDAKRLKRKR